MYKLQLIARAFALFFLSAGAAPSAERQHTFALPHTNGELVSNKRVAIVGAGTAGVSALKTLLVDLPEGLRRGWEVTLYEQRSGVGGVWLPDTGPLPQPPELPETPLYPELRTNTPHPTMTIPHFPFLPETALFPHHEAVQQYHAHVISHFNLTSHVRLSSRIVEARWNGQHWELSVEVRDPLNEAAAPALHHAEADHLLVASGHYHYPYEAEIEGLDSWRLREDKHILHSIYFRHGQDFANRNVLVIGAGSSGRDAARQIARFAKSTVHSRKESVYRGVPKEPEQPDIIYKPRVSAFTHDGVLFDDGSFVSDVDTVILATGYENRIPFLTRGGHLDIVAGSDQTDDKLSTSLRYIRPLYRHIFAIDAVLPPTALAFVGLPIFVSNAITSSSQALLIGYALANSSLLPSREGLLADLHRREESLRAEGYDPTYVGHRLVPLASDADQDSSAAYQDSIVRILQDAGLGGQGGVPPSGQNYTESWRRLGRGRAQLLRRGWERVEEEGENAIDKWIGGVETEEEWADVMEKLVDWEREQEEAA